MDDKQRYDNILRLIKGLKWSEPLPGKPKQASGRCPAHDDQTPSLSVSFGQDGKLLLKCWAGCTTSAICESLGIKRRDLFPYTDDGKGYSACRKIAEVYQYTDELGKTLFEKVRYDPKDFQLRKDPKCWSIEGIRKVLYRLHNIIEHGQSGVVVVEGEKDVATAEWLGFVATTSCESSLWMDDYSKLLCTMPVVIIPHNDETGLSYASKVAESLLDHDCENVKVLRLPVTGVGGDLSSWVEDISVSLDKESTRNLTISMIAETPGYASDLPEFIGVDIRRRILDIKTRLSEVEMLAKEQKRCLDRKR